MKVKIIKTGKTERVSAGYGQRLIEQGKATPVQEARKPQGKAAVKGPETKPGDG